MGVQIEGLEGVMERLGNLPALLAAQGFAEAGDRAGGVIAAEVAVWVPEREHAALLENIIVNVEVDPSKGVSVAVGFRSVISDNGKPADLIAYWVERGHLMLSHDKGPTKLDHVPRHPFMEPAFEASAQRAIEVFTETILAHLETMGV
jgi:hypothetical protein